MEAREVIAACAALWGCTPEEVTGKCRVRHIADARIAAGYCIHVLLGFSTTHTGRLLNCKFTTVLHHTNIARGWLAEPKFNRDNSDKIRELTNWIMMNRDKYRRTLAAQYAERWGDSTPDMAFLAGMIAADYNPDERTVGTLKALATLPATIGQVFRLEMLKNDNGEWRVRYRHDHSGEVLHECVGDLHDAVVEMRELTERKGGET